ncbi:hypothetical protein KBC97_00255 [Candidatus Gracilibacteria bacterium]|nr:hypothetical protein [Candidatus Gracilibacteria bacterium]
MDLNNLPTLADLLAGLDGNILSLLNGSCLLRFLPDGKILAIPDSFRGRMELPKGVDVPFIMVNPTGNGFGATDMLPGNDVQLLLDNTPKVDFKVWRFGSKPNSKQTRVYYSDGNMSTLNLTTTGETLVFDDNMEPLVIKVIDLNDTMDLLVIE